MRDHNVVIPRYDYSCGAGAPATLMRYYFGDHVSEEEILLSVLGPMTREEVRGREENALSLLDLKHCAGQRGYQAVGARMNYADLKRLQGPVLIHLRREDYKHFAVSKGVREDRNYLAEASRGNVRMSVFRFAEECQSYSLARGDQDLDRLKRRMQENLFLQNDTG